MSGSNYLLSCSGNCMYIRHLYSEHGSGEKIIEQWKMQRDMVQRMENQVPEYCLTRLVILVFLLQQQIIKSNLF